MDPIHDVIRNLSRDDIYLLRNIDKYGDPLTVFPVDSHVDKLRRLGLAEEVHLPGQWFRLTYWGQRAIERPTPETDGLPREG